MTAVARLHDFGHYVDLNLLGHCQVIGLTNNPSNITFGSLRLALSNSEINITNTIGEKIDFDNIYFRNNENEVNNDNSIVSFDGLTAKLDVVIKTENGYYPPIQKPVMLPDMSAYTLDPRGKLFNIFVRDSKTFQVNVTNTTKIGYIAKVIHDKLAYPIDIFRLIGKGHSLDFNRTIGDYKIERDMTIRVILSLKGGMFHVTSGRSGNYYNSGITFVNLDTM
jgi:hypothetical protein